MSEIEKQAKIFEELTEKQDWKYAKELDAITGSLLYKASKTDDIKSKERLKEAISLLEKAVVILRGF